MADRFVCNKAEFARIVGDSVRTITRYINEGMPVSNAGKKGQPLQIDTAQAISWYVDKKASSKGYIKPPTGDEQEQDLNSARNLVYIEQHRKLKLENDKTEDTLIPADQVDLVFNSAITMLAAQLDGLAGRVAGGDAVLRQKLLDEHRRIREAYANALQTLAGGFERGGVDEAAAEEGGLEVGEG